MAYPYEAGEAEQWTPPSLEDMDSPPVFWIRWGTTREKRRQKRIMREEGLRTHSDEALRDETLIGMKELLGEKDFGIWLPRVKQYWDAIDAWSREQAELEVEDRTPFKYDDADAVEEVLAQVRKDWRPYCVMRADIAEVNDLMPSIINSVMIEKVEGLDDIALEFERTRHGSYLTLESAEALAETLEVMAFDRNIKAGGDHPVTQLNAKCVTRLYLPKAAEKNSASPPPSAQSPSDTKDSGAASKDGTSKASGRSRKTRAN